jgi:hypothetical protein
LHIQDAEDADEDCDDEDYCTQFGEYENDGF